MHVDMTIRPLVTVGVPVFNGAQYIAATIDSLLAQTLPDFELLISDNASTDETVSICQQYAAKDPRVRVIRQQTNIGLAHNWNVLVHEARGEYFKWCSASDLCLPAFLERCVAVLKADPSLVACYGRTRFTDAQGRPGVEYLGDCDIDQPRPSDRYWTAVQALKLNNPMFGVIRTAVLRATGLDRSYPSGDTVLTAELALHGRIRLVPEVLLVRRQAPGTFSALRSAVELQRLYEPTAARPLKLLTWRRYVDHLKTISRAPLCTHERLRVYGLLARMLVWDRSHLGRELRECVLPERS